MAKKNNKQRDIILRQGTTTGGSATRTFYTFQSEKFQAFANAQNAANDHTVFTTPTGVIK